MPIPFLSVFAAFQGIRASHSIAVPGINASKESCSEHDVLNLMQEFMEILEVTESDAGITCVAILCFQYKKILRRLPSKWLTFCGGSLHLCKVGFCKKNSIHFQLFFPQAQPDFRTFIHLGIHSDLMAQLFQDLPA